MKTSRTLLHDVVNTTAQRDVANRPLANMIGDFRPEIEMPPFLMTIDKMVKNVRKCIKMSIHFCAMCIENVTI